MNPYELLAAAPKIKASDFVDSPFTADYVKGIQEINIKEAKEYIERAGIKISEWFDKSAESLFLKSFAYFLHFRYVSQNETSVNPQILNYLDVDRIIIMRNLYNKGMKVDVINAVTNSARRVAFSYYDYKYEGILEEESLIESIKRTYDTHARVMTSGLSLW